MSNYIKCTSAMFLEIDLLNENAPVANNIEFTSFTMVVKDLQKFGRKP